MIYNNKYLDDILMVCEIKDLIWEMHISGLLRFKREPLLIEPPGALEYKTPHKFY